jgi:dihydropteroate synthase
MRPNFEWNLGTRSFELGKRTIIMGVVNVTPDSFSDGGRFLDHKKAVEQAERLLQEGGDIIDIGGESTRPGARVDSGAGKQELGKGDLELSLRSSRTSLSVSAEEEVQRIIPVISELKKRYPSTVISVDTYKAVVARAAVNAGAEIVNDVSGLRWDPQMAKTVAELKCGTVLMHMRGRPEEWRNLPPANDIVSLVKEQLGGWTYRAIAAGVRRESIVLDPGFGFGKNFEQNYPLINRFHELHALGFPLLAGTSRKSFIGRTLRENGRDADPDERLYGTLATETALILKGAHIIRAHDVKPARDAARIADAILAST